MRHKLMSMCYCMIWSAIFVVATPMIFIGVAQAGATYGSMLTGRLIITAIDPSPTPEEGFILTLVPTSLGPLPDGEMAHTAGTATAQFTGSASLIGGAEVGDMTFLGVNEGIELAPAVSGSATASLSEAQQWLGGAIGIDNFSNQNVTVTFELGLSWAITLSADSGDFASADASIFLTQRPNDVFPELPLPPDSLCDLSQDFDTVDDGNSVDEGASGIVCTFLVVIPAGDTNQIYARAFVGGFAQAGAQTVAIDIKPGSDPNCFNNDGNGVIPVAILGSAAVDVTQIDPASVMLESLSVAARGKNQNKLLAHIDDINNDGHDDLVVQIEDIDGVFTSGNGTATLTGALFDGTAIEGSDAICVVPTGAEPQ